MINCPKCKAKLIGTVKHSVYGTEEKYRCLCGYYKVCYYPNKAEDLDDSVETVVDYWNEINILKN